MGAEYQVEETEKQGQPKLVRLCQLGSQTKPGGKFVLGVEKGESTQAKEQKSGVGREKKNHPKGA